MLRFTKCVAISAMIAGTSAIAGAQAEISPLKPISFGISVGAAIPVGDLSNGTNTGYDVTGSVALELPALPFGIRGDAAYNSFGVKQDVANSLGVDNGNARILVFTGNLVFPLPIQRAVLRPYLIGGLGLYNIGASATVSSGGFSARGSNSENDLGYNAGAGIAIPLSGFNTFIEARFHRVDTSGGTTTFVPITFGVMF